MRVLITFAALFASVALLQVSSGAVGPLDALSGAVLGFSNAEIGMLGSAHYIGFFIGCWGAPRLLGTVGHSRAFAAFTAAGAIGLLAHMMVVHPLAWAGLRVTTGLCVAGCYTIIESWLNARLTNETRGRATGLYRVVDLGAALIAQLMIAVLPPAEYVSYNLLAILCCMALLPIALTQASQPAVPKAPRLRPALALAKSPLAAAAVIVAGLTSAAFRMVGPIYGQDVGLRSDQIGLFLAAYVLGGALAQYPTGWLADRFDRRRVLIALSVAAIASCAITIHTQSAGTLAVFGAALLFGVTTFPIFSVAAAHAHDFASDDERVELSAALMFMFAVGAIASPLVSSLLIEARGPMALFVFLGLGHLVLVVFGLARMRVRPAPQERTDYVYTPRTSFTIGRLLGRKR
ncbi:putative major facilitator superfamily (MFS) transporter [Dinoroseobacter shibae DFL 12 = DSM 16493]|jgi:MFS family permease|uniref:Putative major facilitator superfamily (MFS) transporter n=1 Tax=Dinoroseobacter shibae (strain DSM 16493 / NCIMB 14021 / DFL 12) TaxID=398580 RepID=A8LIJ8_DINSH|nr:MULTISPECIES: MFS transporter [Dinoroseobacter]ABV94439.1 putative major facilitator superfamily (MFS) transporter [Dinoroseobacter shibae DFL 12 = DSM 16493]MDD9717598.1 MFS transporter [Dinoroseobacter sp. PD6]URF45866.1 MFS transporter [Dinoroseobacter shibae]URF50173.1 MFS transporter [Dinoroseobacter shibae]